MADVDDNSRKAIVQAVGVLLSTMVEISVASSSSSDEELNMLETVTPLLVSKKRKRRVSRVQNYVEAVIPRMTDSDFKSHFRMKRESFEYVLSFIGHRLKRSYPGLGMISPENQFLLAIWRMATPDSYRSICEKFDVSRSTALHTVRRVTAALVAIAPALIRWPTRALAEDIWQGFEGISAYPKVIGAIDGTHIQIPAPRVNPEAYINRKSYYSIQLQGICDHKARFTHCHVGHVGSVHDQRVFRLSEVHEFLGEEEKFPDNCHLIGDLAYKLHPNLIVPYRDNGHLTDRQKNFNFCLSSARISIERAFGLLKGRFRCLQDRLPMTQTKNIANFVLACCVLHNVCILHKDEVDATVEEIEVLSGVNEHRNRTIQAPAIAKRDLICEQLIMRDV